MLSAEAKKRLATSTGGPHPRPTVTLPEAEKGESRERAAKAVEMLPLLQEEARKRQATSESGVYGAKPLLTKLPEVVGGTSREIAAKAVGVGSSSPMSAPEALRRLAARRLKAQRPAYRGSFAYVDDPLYRKFGRVAEPESKSDKKLRI